MEWIFTHIKNVISLNLENLVDLTLGTCSYASRKPVRHSRLEFLARPFWVFYKNLIREAYTNQTEVIKYNALDSYTNDILLKGLRKFCHSMEIIYDSYYMIHSMSYDL